MTTRDRAIDRVLQVAEGRFGLGIVSGPQWVRDRVGSFLDAFAERNGIPPEAAAEEMIAQRGPMNELIATLRVGETRFFRDAPQWEAVVRYVCEHVPLGAPINALSAGCSTGEEAYTLAILLGEQGRRFQVLGVDRANDAIVTARAATYPAEALREVPRGLVDRYFEPQGALYTVRAPTRALVSFERRDLATRPPRGPYDLILFKNVLLYLTEPIGTQVALRLGRALSEEGILVSAAAEVVRLSAILDPVRVARGVIAFRPRHDQ